MNKKIIISCMIGNALEWFEFTIYGYFAAVIGHLFFPSSDPVVSTISAFAVFSAGFLMRPLGAAIFGHIGDRVGRKKALVLSIYLIALPTASIALMPTYDTIGILAPILLTTIRLLQGISIGGEYTGSIIFIIEHSNDKKRGFAGSFATLSLAIGIILGSLTSYIIFSLFTDAQITQFAWRIPFVLSVFGALAGVIMRRTLQDPKIYLKHKKADYLYKLPIKELFHKHYKPLFHTICLEMIMAVGFYIIFIFYVIYLKDFLGIKEGTAYYINFISTVIFAAIIPISGYLSDKYGRKKVLFPALAILLVGTWPVSLLSPIGVEYAAFSQIFCAFLLGILFGPFPALLVEMFPLKVRYTGISIAHNLSMCIFGGTMPLLATSWIHDTGNLQIPAYLIIAATAFSMIGLHFMQDKSTLTLEKLG